MIDHSAQSAEATPGDGTPDVSPLTLLLASHAARGLTAAVTLHDCPLSDFDGLDVRFVNTPGIGRYLVAKANVCGVDVTSYSVTLPDEPSAGRYDAWREAS